LAGDDGVGPEVIRRLAERYSESPGVRLERLGGDLYAVADLLAESQRLIFVDAVVREPPGQLVLDEDPVPSGAPSASLHQSDIGVVMRQLATLALVDPFPAWSLWGVTIQTPTELREGLSPAVERGVALLCEALGALVSGVAQR
jgi:hydrogenase maturation protease